MRLLGGADEEPESGFASRRTLKAGVITLVGLAGVTAASGAISSLRRRKERRSAKSK